MNRGAGSLRMSISYLIGQNWRHIFFGQIKIVYMTCPAISGLQQHNEIFASVIFVCKFNPVMTKGRKVTTHWWCQIVKVDNL